MFAAVGAAGIYGVVVWNRWGEDPALSELLRRLADEARAHGYTLADLSTWQPPATTRGRKAKT